jgi:hypothetical protein
VSKLKENPCLQAALSELAKVGIRDVEKAYGGKHLQIRFRSNGSHRAYSMPLTPSDWRSPNNTRSDIRKILKKNGVLLTTERKPPPTPKPDRVTLLERRVAALERIIEEYRRAAVPAHFKVSEEGGPHGQI